jgi:SNF2 family DNA or RNA helicase
MAKDTIDEKIVQALKRKNQLSAKTLGDKAKDWLL